MVTTQQQQQQKQQQRSKAAWQQRSVRVRACACVLVLCWLLRSRVGDGGFHRHTHGKHDDRGLSEVFKGVGGFFYFDVHVFVVSAAAVSTVTQTET